MEYKEWVKEQKANAFISAVKIEDNEYMNDQIMETLRELYEDYDATPKQLRTLAKALTYGGLYRAFRKGVFGYYTLQNVMRDYLSKCNALEMEMNATDLINHYGLVCEMYNLRKDEMTAKTLKQIKDFNPVLQFEFGDYQVVVSNSHNCETRKDFSVVANPAPKLKGDTLKHLCENSTVTLTVNGAEHYQWSKSGKKVGSDSNKYRASSSGTFMVVGTSANGCSDTAKVKVELAVKPKITDIVKPACGTAEGLIALQTDKKCIFKWFILIIKTIIYLWHYHINIFIAI